MGKIFHSVTLNREKCKGCTTCIRYCPTEAIRVRHGKARIIDERCIDCGRCIDICPHRAKKAVCDPLDMTGRFEYKIALPAPSFYGQFKNVSDVGVILTAIKAAGFDEVFEVARAAEILSDFTRKSIDRQKDLKSPVISSACPTCVRLIQQRFPSLIPNIISHVAPVELAAMLAKAAAAKATSLPPEKIGVFLISPCPAKVTAARNPLGLEKPVIDGVFSMSEIYIKVLAEIKKTDAAVPEVPAGAGIIGVGWSVSGGEGAALLNQRYLAVDGITNVVKVLEDIENGKLQDIDFVELNSCTQGCVGGCLTVENPYVAKTRIRSLMKYLPVSKNRVGSAVEDGMMLLEKDFEQRSVWRLDSDIESAFSKMKEINALCEALPGLDCGSCGAPSCRAFAEDVVMGMAQEDDCIFRMRERMQYMTGSSDEYLPPPFRRGDEDKDEDGGGEPNE